MISFLVPYSPDGGWRDRAWAWNQRRIRAHFPTAEVIVGVPDVTGDPAVFNHPQAINRAAEYATGDVFVILDADTTWPSRTWLRNAVDNASQPGTWSLAAEYVKVDEHATHRMLLDDPARSYLELPTNEWVGASWSGVVVCSREAFEHVGGSDERHLGWGWDDICFGITLDTLWGPHARIPGFVLHLYHPQPVEHSWGQPYTATQRALTRRYEAAAGDPDAVRAIRAELVA